MDVVFKRSMHGFTLIELVLVIVIAGIFMIVPLISWQGASLNLSGQAELLANDIRYAQALSMTKGDRFYLIRVSNSAYQIRNSAGTAILLSQGNTTQALNTGITFGTFTNLPNNLVAFNGEGIPYIDTGSPGTALSSTATLPMTASGKIETVTITPTTGRVSIQ